MLFKDDATGFRFVYFIKYKSDVFDKFVEFERLVFNKIGRTIKTLRTDNGTEYRNAKMDEYRKTRGITLETTVPNTPEQNGRSSAKEEAKSVSPASFRLGCVRLRAETENYEV